MYVKNYNNNSNNIKTTDKFYVIKYRKGSALPGLKKIYKTIKNIDTSKNEIHNYSPKKIYINNNKIINIKKECNFKT